MPEVIEIAQAPTGPRGIAQQAATAGFDVVVEQGADDAGSTAWVVTAQKGGAQLYGLWVQPADGGPKCHGVWTSLDHGTPLEHQQLRTAKTWLATR